VPALSILKKQSGSQPDVRTPQITLIQPNASPIPPYTYIRQCLAWHGPCFSMTILQCRPGHTSLPKHTATYLPATGPGRCPPGDVVGLCINTIMRSVLHLQGHHINRGSVSIRYSVELLPNCRVDRKNKRPPKGPGAFVSVYGYQMLCLDYEAGPRSARMPVNGGPSLAELRAFIPGPGALHSKTSWRKACWGHRASRTPFQSVFYSYKISYFAM
jgi:hypothetical protein